MPTVIEKSILKIYNNKIKCKTGERERMGGRKAGTEREAKSEAVMFFNLMLEGTYISLLAYSICHTDDSSIDEK